MEVRIFDKNHIQAIIGDDIALVKEIVRGALQLHYEKTYVQPAKQYVRRPEEPHIADRIISMPVAIGGADPVSGIKWIGSKRANTAIGLHRASAVIVLNNPETNYPCAILDGSLISALRTVAVSLIAIDRLRPNATSVAIIGMGRLGTLHAELISKHYPGIRTIQCYSTRENFDAVLSLRGVKKSATLAAAINGAEIVITTTTAEHPYIGLGDIGDEKIMINLSLMDFGLDVYQNSDIIVDDLMQCKTAKKVFREGVDSGKIDPAQVYELSDILFGTGKTRQFSKRIIVNPIGMALEDIWMAWTIYKKLQNAGLPEFEVE